MTRAFTEFRIDVTFGVPATSPIIDIIGELTQSLADRYTIERELGEGGMATVFLARDLKHDRHVAIKVLKPELSAVLGVERFLAEIKVTANLQHPNLLPLFDSGNAGGLLFYVMPFVDGETLRARLDREKQLSVAEATRIAVAIANALDYAHSRGVIHRDLKPANILMQSGQPVIADFGIALAVSRVAGERVTQTGLTVGTPQYMSPEQATGDRTIDGRSDIYSLAAVLYEMLIGDPPHLGSSAQTVIMRVVTERPTNVRVLRPAVPEHIAHAIEKALEKMPADRWDTARAFADALETTAPFSLRVGAATPAARRRAPLISAAAGGFALVAVAGALLWGRNGEHREESRPATRFPLSFAANERIATTMGSPVAISPDGKVIAYSGVGIGGAQQLFTRALDEIRARPILDTDDAERPMFSPDGNWLAFMTRGHFRKVPVAGGPVVALPEVSDVNGSSWGSNDMIVVSSGGRLNVASANGGASRAFGRLDSTTGEMGQRWPRLLADGKTVLYTSWRTGLDNARIAVASLETGKTTQLGLSGTFPLGVAGGQLIYASVNGSLLAIPFDERSQRVTGAPKIVVENLLVSSDGAAKAALSSNGSLVYQTGKSTMRIVLADGRGGSKPLIAEPGMYEFPRFSPDGKRIAFTVSLDSATNVWTYELSSGALRQVTTGGTINDRPEWMSDSKHLLFDSNRRGMTEIWTQAVDGSASARPLLQLPNAQILEAVISKDGHTLVYRTGSQDIFYRRLDGDTSAHAVAATAAGEFAPRLSPDGRFVAYSSDETGVAQVYVRPFPGLGDRFQVSVDGGTEPVWSPDGRRLFYRRNRLITAATIAASPRFSVAKREELFEGDFLFQGVHAEYDISPDGKQFLVMKVAASDVQTIVVQNWLSELRLKTTTNPGK